MKISEAKESIDKIISKARVHLYKPIQIAEILYRDRVYNDIDLSNLESYRSKSKKWRDVICIRFLGRTSTSSAKYQDDLFNKNAVPPEAIATLAAENRVKNGIVEAYIYNKFSERYNQISSALEYSSSSTRENFKLQEFFDRFWREPGLKRSIDKIYEIVVYSLFSVLVDELEVKITVEFNPVKMELLKEFENFAKKVICIDSNSSKFTSAASINRVGVTNAADRGLDMWANFGPAIQIKHLTLNEKLAAEIVGSITSDRIVIICKDSEEKVINSLLTQIGWRTKIQSIITISELKEWYEKALRGIYGKLIGDKLLQSITDEIILEFPIADESDFQEFYNNRGYNKLYDNNWL
ncbi:MAG: HaeII family restriction endonuclease [Trichodesmium sp.]